MDTNKSIVETLNRLNTTPFQWDDVICPECRRIGCGSIEYGGPEEGFWLVCKCGANIRKIDESAV